MQAQEFTLESLLKTPYISNLATSPESADVLFTVKEQGARNVYIASSPDYKCRKLTNFNDDDEQEITDLKMSWDGLYAVFVRGGDHASNSSVRPTNPASAITVPKIVIYSINLKSGEVQQIGEGDYPIIHPDSKWITFLKQGQAWHASIDGSTNAKRLFYARGTVGAMQWSPDGQKLAFASRRGDHSFIGIYENKKKHIEWLAPSFYKDDYPKWSPNGNQLTFIRQPGSGGALDSLLVKKHLPWSIMVSDIQGGSVKEIWKAPTTLPGSVPSEWPGRFNLNWPTLQRIVFLSYQDGWPHLYSIEPSGNNVTQLTKGTFSVDQIGFSSDGKQVVFCANTGAEKQDIDRRHIGVVAVDGGKYKMLTTGNSITSSPAFINKDKALVILNGTAMRPGLPAIINPESKSEPKLIGKELLGNFNFEQLIVPEQVTFSSEDGLQIYGQLFKPKNLKKKAPAIVYIHGGPRRQMYLGWHFIDAYFYDYALNQYLANKGFIVLSVNYRMGTGYGFDFQYPKNVHIAGASEYQDILASGKWLARRNDVDANKIGVYGGSYGGYLTAFALGKNSDIFKAGVDIHGAHNRLKGLNEWANNHPDFAEAAKTAWESSPSRWVDGWKSPVLIIHGDDDRAVAFSQSMDLVNRLRNKGAEAEYLVIPDETHSWVLYSNLLKVKQATADYLIKHLKN